MKRTYKTPTIVVVEIANKERLLTVSGGSKGIGYGGIDDGTHIPGSRGFDDFFDDFDEE